MLQSVEEGGGNIPVATYKCTGDIPANATLIPGDDKGLKVDTPRKLVKKNTAKKCEYTCNLGYVWTPGYSVGHSGVCSSIQYNCTGPIPANATLIPGDDEGLMINTQRKLVERNSPAKCEYRCNVGYTLQNGHCVTEKFSCVYGPDAEIYEGRENVYYRLYINGHWIDFTEHPELRDQYLCKNSSAKNPEEHTDAFSYECCHRSGKCETCLIRKETQEGGSSDDSDVCIFHHKDFVECKSPWTMVKGSFNSQLYYEDQFGTARDTTWQCTNGRTTQNCSETSHHGY